MCFACLARLYELFVGTLISLMNAYARRGRPTLNLIERFDLGRSVPTVKPLHFVSVGRNVQYLQNVDQFGMNELEDVLHYFYYLFRHSLYYSMRYR